MQIIDILTRPLTSKENKQLIIFCLVGVFWLICVFLLAYSEQLRALIAILPLQAVLTILYADYRAAVVKKEMLHELDELKFALKVQGYTKNL